ncbi:hypothetical protein [Nocardia seriolae]|uniref:Uncharacterized protein n=1 Tax=Nocardia seriolae TaxID=37332 RepID=A0A0B8N1Q4_9NOCA|nr:hypothetical protein [Nocardia seriolae]APA98197.1 hypothetical protein NS506_04149 [Nocardia seriolae]MTJ62883.1 hypothetical protein [Nocardia seriolae]MTJ72678.1 hypothetical protein [Nocardia seriolae]MTJ87914.1 hypothetical protein [Nocardia seriolae]MTK31905.1 hypothetical protein [Nocardia seriolae]
MTGLRMRRRSLAIAGAVCLAAAALVAVSVPASAESDTGALFVSGLRLYPAVPSCVGAVLNSPRNELMA